VEICPCGSSKMYQECCEPYLLNKTLAPTAEALMRSRYTAYTKADIDYIERTMKGPALIQFDKNESKTWANEIEWLGLTVIQATQHENRGTVEFVARYKAVHQKHIIHEKSEFILENGTWYYTNGITPKVGRNDACPCGSTKKFKKCCGEKD
jgi:SEC-C motif-containing protein